MDAPFLEMWTCEQLNCTPINHDNVLLQGSTKYLLSHLLIYKIKVLTEQLYQASTVQGSPFKFTGCLKQSKIQSIGKWTKGGMMKKNIIEM